MIDKIYNLIMFRNYPNQVKYILWNEGAERFSFYGMRAILTIYMVQYLMFTNTEATSIYHLFVSVVYLTPLLGAYLADKFWGKYQTIMLFSLLYCVGQVSLALIENRYGLLIGLSLIALGAGGIKPCVSAFIGDQIPKSQPEKLRTIFLFFYFMVNLGSFFSSLIIPFVRGMYGAQVAFLIPAVLMFIATLFLWLGRKEYVMNPPDSNTEHSFLKVLGSAIRNFKNRDKSKGFLSGAAKEHPEEYVEGALAVFNIAKVYAIIIMFWALFDQQGSSWVIQAQHMNLQLWGMTLEPDIMQAWNPIMVMILVPIFSLYLYPKLDKTKFSLTPLRRIGVGMAIAGVAFLQMGWIQEFLDAGVQLHVLWQFVPYLVITIAEVFISITGLEFAYSQAPRFMKSTIMSLWLLTTFIGNMFTAVISELNIFSGPAFFYFFGILPLVLAVVFIPIAKSYKYRYYN